MAPRKMPKELFAKIHLDSEIRNTVLEGGNAIESAAYLNNMAKEYVQEHPDKSPQLSSLITSLDSIEINKNWKAIDATLKERLRKIILNQRKSIKENIENIETIFIEESKETLTDSILSLEEGKKITLDGGMAGSKTGGSGHSVIYQFEKKEGKIIIHVFNTGLGVERHSTDEHLWFETEAQYEITDQSKLSQLLKKLVCPKQLRILLEESILSNIGDPLISSLNKELHDKYNMDYVYQTLDDLCTQNLTPSSTPIRSHLGQEAGTCSHRVFTPLMYAEITDKAVLQEFRAFYKIQSIFLFHEEIKNSKDLDDWKILRRAIKRMIRIIQEKTPEMNIEEKKHTIDKLNNLAQQADTILKNAHKPFSSPLETYRIRWQNDYEKNILLKSGLEKPNQFEEKEYLPKSSISLNFQYIENQLNSIIKNGQINLDELLAIFKNIDLNGDDHFSKRLIIENVIQKIIEKQAKINTESITSIPLLNDAIKRLHNSLQTYLDYSKTPNYYNIPFSPEAYRASNFFLQTANYLFQSVTHQLGYAPEPWHTNADQANLSKKHIGCVLSHTEFGKELEELKANDSEEDLNKKKRCQGEMVNEILENKVFKDLYQEIVKLNTKEEISEKIFLGYILKLAWHSNTKKPYNNTISKDFIDKLKKECPYAFRDIVNENYLEDENRLDKYRELLEFINNSSLFSSYARLFYLSSDCLTMKISDHYEGAIKISQSGELEAEIYESYHGGETPFANQLLSFREYNSIAKNNRQWSEFINYNKLSISERSFLRDLLLPYNKKHYLIIETQAQIFSSPEFFAKNTIDFFHRFPEKLTETAYTLIFKCGLFGAPDFKDLVNHPEMKSSLFDIIRYCTNIFIDTNNVNFGIFIAEVIHYLKNNSIYDEKYQGCLMLIMQQLNPLTISNSETLKKYYSLEIIQQLEDFKNKSPFTNQEEQIESLARIIKLYAKQPILTDNQDYLLYMEASTLYAKWVFENESIIKNNQQAIINLILPLIDNTASAQDVNFTSFPPLITVNNFSFNIYTGKIFDQNGLTPIARISEIHQKTFHINSSFSLLSKGPDEVINNKIFIDKIHNMTAPKFEYYVMRSEGKELYSLARSKEAGFEFKFQLDDTKRPQVYLSFTNKNEFYRKVSPQLIGIQKSELSFIPEFFPEATYWFDDHDTIFVMDGQMHLCAKAKLQLNGNISAVTILNTEAHNDWQLILRNQYQQSDKFISLWGSIHNLESSNKFLILKSATTDKHKIEIPHFAINFSEDDNGNYRFSGDENLFMDIEQGSFLPGSVLLRNEEEDHFVLIPDLPFIVDNSNSNSCFPQAKMDIELRSFHSFMHQDSAEHAPQLTNKSCFLFKLDNKGFPIATNPQEKLFLCYYFLNIQQYNKAFECIKDFRTFDVPDGSFEMAEILFRIIHKSPAVLDENPSFDRGANHDEINAIKMQALLIATDINLSGKTAFNTNSKNNTLPTDYNTEVIDFYRKFPDRRVTHEIITYVRKVSQGIYRKSMRLSENELNVLLPLEMKSRLQRDRIILSATSKTSENLNEPTEYKFDISPYLVLRKIDDHLNQCSSFHSKFQTVWDNKINSEAADEQKPSGNIDDTLSYEMDLKSSRLQRANSFFNIKDNLIGFECSIKELCSEINTSLAEQNNILLNLCLNIRQYNSQLRIAELSEDLKPISIEDIIFAYLQNDKFTFAKKLGIDINSDLLNTVFSLTESLMKLSIQAKRLNTIHDRFQSIDKTNASDDEKINFIQALEEQESVYQLTDPSDRMFLVFEYYQNDIRLRQNQIDSIKHILTTGNENDCVQFIMGGGKTSVFLPIVAASKADGYHLSMVIVPESLITVNEQDINKKTANLFSSKAYTLHYDRTSPSSMDDFSRILAMLKHVKDSRGFLIVSRETLQALELKYLELLSEDNANPESIDYLANILSEFKNNGKAIIDEVDSVLNIRKEFNYKTGKDQELPTTLISDVINLYRVFLDLKINFTDITRSNVEEKIQLVINEIIQNRHSFINNILMGDAEIPELLKQDLKKYLSGNDPSINLQTWLNQASDQAKERLSLLRWQAISLLKLCLTREYNVNYGYSKEHPENRVVIPYNSNNVPAETSRFNSSYETLNLTIQACLCTPISHELFSEFIKEFYQNHIRERNNSEFDINNLETKFSVEFQNLTGKNLIEVYSQLQKGENFSGFLQELTNDSEKDFNLKFYLLQHVIGPQIKNTSEVIRSDNICFVDMLFSSVGVSGTLQNHNTFHPRMRYAADLNPEMDQRTLYFIQKKNCLVQKHKLRKIEAPQLNEELQQFISNPKTRAIIDAGALFSGSSNFQIAQELAILFKKKEDNLIQYILYFDENNRLMALPLSDLPNPIYLERSDADYLREKLGSGPEACFSFYDHSHTTGTNIKQMPDAHAIVTIGENTHTRDLVQSVMRMRAFEDNQTVEFLVSSAASPDSFSQVSDVIRFCAKNEKNDLLQDNYQALCKKISALVRNQFMNILLSGIATAIPADDQLPENLDKRHKARKIAYEIFKYRLISKTESIYNQFGGSLNEVPIQEALDALIKNELRSYEEAINKFNSEMQNNYPEVEFRISENQMDFLKSELDKLAQSSIQHCPEHVLAQFSRDTGQAEVQEEVHVQQQIKQQVQEQIEDLDPYNLREIRSIKWQAGLISNKEEIKSISLTHFSSSFNSQIFITENYGLFDNTEHSIQKESAMQHPGIFCFYRREKRDGSLSCTLLTPEEASDCLKQHDSWSSPEADFWLESPSGNLLYSPSSSRPANIETTPNYCQMREQICFFHGDVDILIKNKPTGWIANFNPDPTQFLLNVLSSRFMQDKNKWFSLHADEFDNYLLESLRISNHYENLAERSPDLMKKLDSIQKHLPLYPTEIISTANIVSKLPSLFQILAILHEKNVLQFLTFKSKNECIYFLHQIKQIEEHNGIALADLLKLDEPRHFTFYIELLSLLVNTLKIEPLIALNFIKNYNPKSDLFNFYSQLQSIIEHNLGSEFTHEESHFILNNTSQINQLPLLFAVRPRNLTAIQIICDFYKSEPIPRSINLPDLAAIFKSNNLLPEFARYLPSIKFSDSEISKTILDIYASVISQLPDEHILDIFSEKANVHWGNNFGWYPFIYFNDKERRNVETKFPSIDIPLERAINPFIIKQKNEKALELKEKILAILKKLKESNYKATPFQDIIILLNDDLANVEKYIKKINQNNSYSSPRELILEFNEIILRCLENLEQANKKLSSDVLQTEIKGDSDLPDIILVLDLQQSDNKEGLERFARFINLPGSNNYPAREKGDFESYLDQLPYISNLIEGFKYSTPEDLYAWYKATLEVAHTTIIKAWQCSQVVSFLIKQNKIQPQDKNIFFLKLMHLVPHITANIDEIIKQYDNKYTHLNAEEILASFSIHYRKKQEDNLTTTGDKADKILLTDTDLINILQKITGKKSGSVMPLKDPMQHMIIRPVSDSYHPNAWLGNVKSSLSPANFVLEKNHIYYFADCRNSHWTIRGFQYDGNQFIPEPVDIIDSLSDRQADGYSCGDWTIAGLLNMMKQSDIDTKLQEKAEKICQTYVKNSATPDEKRQNGQTLRRFFIETARLPEPANQRQLELDPVGSKRPQGFFDLPNKKTKSTNDSTIFSIERTASPHRIIPNPSRVKDSLPNQAEGWYKIKNENLEYLVLKKPGTTHIKSQKEKLLDSLEKYQSSDSDVTIPEENAPIHLEKDDVCCRRYFATPLDTEFQESSHLNNLGLPPCGTLETCISPGKETQVEIILPKKFELNPNTINKPNALFKAFLFDYIHRIVQNVLQSQNQGSPPLRNPVITLHMKTTAPPTFSTLQLGLIQYCHFNNYPCQYQDANGVKVSLNTDEILKNHDMETKRDSPFAKEFYGFIQKQNAKRMNQAPPSSYDDGLPATKGFS